MKKPKLIIQIPCLNEEKTIGQVVKSIPNKIAQISKIEILVIDDGSTDNTIKEAKTAGAKYIYSNISTLGLARTFSIGIQKSVELGADIIVNTDGDNQYDQKEIIKLIAPIISGKADMVIGNRQIQKLVHMPKSKKIGNIIGSWTIRFLTKTNIQDASSGFRAFNRKAVSSFNLISEHTYTHETIIQAVNKGLIITEVPITFKKRISGESRLINSIWKHIKFSLATIIRALLMYKAFKYLVTGGSVIVIVGLIGTLRFLYFFLTGDGNGHTQSLVFSSVLIGVGFNTILLGIIADLISINRKMIERK
ncbi:MAG: glycosyltransferase family 2 protein [Candidatus Staskawiczbacteria bacterium]|nr:glycosyltransferase family 2 protein [Candidatus Staskawiczbacteria bacterium]